MNDLRNPVIRKEISKTENPDKITGIVEKKSLNLINNKKVKDSKYPKTNA